MSIAVNWSLKWSSKFANFGQPCQSLFVAPCSHVWHYKCIRPILNDHKTWPNFLCPNCRAFADLEADIEDLDGWDDDNMNALGDAEHPGASDVNGNAQDSTTVDRRAVSTPANASMTPTTSTTPSIQDEQAPSSASASVLSASSTSLLDRRGVAKMPSPFNSTDGAPSATRRAEVSRIEYLAPITPTQPLLMDHENANVTPTTEQLTTEGPLTPTNNAGPFVFDGSAGRADSRRRTSRETSDIER